MTDKHLRGAESQDGGGSVVLLISFIQERRHKFIDRCVTAREGGLMKKRHRLETRSQRTRHSLVNEVFLVLSVGSIFHQRLSPQECRELFKSIFFEDLQHFLCNRSRQT